MKHLILIIAIILIVIGMTQLSFAPPIEISQPSDKVIKIDSDTVQITKTEVHNERREDLLIKRASFQDRINVLQGKIDKIDSYLEVMK